LESETKPESEGFFFWRNKKVKWKKLLGSCLCEKGGHELLAAPFIPVDM
jgi:hypothetical protein